ncbi:MAG: T9SS type A sorting domain-containing protein [Flavobacteriales bacterium]|nr:T9SS type A sorting domain-containing protein [Flavobacteriales bacterium]MCA0392027.1 T9SS type A sorting domain-containing protein [Bacteroidota bacterium]
MKTKLPLLMLIAMPILGFGQSNAKRAVHQPNVKKIATASTLAPAKFPLAYCTPALDCTDGDLITNVTIGTINNTSTCGANGYSDYTAITTNVQAGQTYPISVTVGTGWAYENVSVWIDYNKNETFEASEFTHIGNRNGNPTGVVINNNITIPAGTPSGNYRMRVRVAADAANAALDPTFACDETQGYGESEDYTLVIPVVGCLNATNGQWPSATFTPNCNGSPANITTAAYLNEYSKVNVTSGVPYTFSTSNASYFITISDEAGTTSLAAGVGSVTWTPTASGVVRFYSHLDNTCGGGNTIHSRIIKCGTPPPPAVNCADFKVPSNNRENGGFFGGSTAQRLAIDLPVNSSALTVYGIEPIVAGTATSFSFKIYNDSGDLPGTELATRTGTIVGSTVTGNAFGYDFIKYTVAFDTPLNLAANTKYWIEVVSDAVAWESTTANKLGSFDVFLNSNTAGAWTHGTSEYVFNLICNSLGVNDLNKAGFSYHPNPVKDYLTITSKKAVESVYIYNGAGQKVHTSMKLVDGKINMSKMAPGVYLVNAILSDGTNQSFKVIKQ